jgi:transcriptional regulator with XRE-family HTH domain
MESITAIHLAVDDGFTERLRAIIGTHSQRAFAREIGLSSGTISKYLAGLIEPSRPILIAMAKGAGVEVGWLATGEGPMLATEAIEQRLIAGVSPDAPMKAELERISQSSSLPDPLRAHADTLLDLAFGDGDASLRRGIRLSTVSAGMKIGQAADQGGAAAMEPPASGTEILARSADQVIAALAIVERWRAEYGFQPTPEELAAVQFDVAISTVQAAERGEVFDTRSALDMLLRQSTRRNPGIARGIASEKPPGNGGSGGRSKRARR